MIACVSAFSRACRSTSLVGAASIWYRFDVGFRPVHYRVPKGAEPSKGSLMFRNIAKTARARLAIAAVAASLVVPHQ
jgi:hypothetical protein